jgi:uncharacterized protein YeeX (DUF496 family)
MMLYLCAAIILLEWEDKSMEADDMMENIQHLKNLELKERVPDYIAKALELHKKFSLNLKKTQELSDFLDAR